MAHLEYIRTLKGHSDGIRDAIVWSKGNLAMTSSSDHTIKIWNFNTGTLLTTLEGHQQSVDCVRISLDGKYIISSSSDGLILIWDRISGQLIRSLRGHDGKIWSLIISPDNKYIISGSYDSTIRLWDVDTGKPLKILRGNSGQVQCIAVSPDWTKIVAIMNEVIVGFVDLRINIPNIKGQSIKESTQQVIREKVLDNQLIIWDLQTGQIIQSFKGFPDGFNMIIITPDGKFCISTNDTGLILIWNLITGNLEQKWQAHKQALTGLAISPSGNYFYSATFDGELKVWDWITKTEIQSIHPHKDICNINISEDGKFLITASDDKTAQIWEIGRSTDITLPPEILDSISSIMKGLETYLAGEKHEREIFQQNLVSLYRLEINREFKYSMIAMGSLLEHLLLKYCTQKSLLPVPFIDENGSKNEGKAFANFLAAAIENKLFNEQKRWELFQDYLRDFRNYVHISKEIKSTPIDEGWYNTLKPAFDVIIRVFTSNPLS